MKSKAAVGTDPNEWLADGGVTRTFRYPLGIRILLLLGACFFAFVSVWVPNVEDPIIVPLCFGPLALFNLVLFVWTSYSYKVSWNHIGWHCLGREKRMRWDEIGRIKHRGRSGDLELCHRSGSCSIKLDAQKDGFRRQRLSASTIKELRMETTRAGNAMVHPVVVELKNGKKISLVGFREGSPRLFHALVAWLQKNGV